MCGKPLDVNAPDPAQVGLTAEGAKGCVFRRCPGDQRLYVYDRDSPTHSACTKDCTKTWSPVLAPASAKTLGAWTVIRRDDGRSQWAYRGRPVYTLIQDTPFAPKGDGREGGKWHLLPYEK